MGLTCSTASPPPVDPWYKYCGMSAYPCYKCGGATKRCGTGGEHVPDTHTGYPEDYKGPLAPCKGGPWCWEDNCVLEPIRILHVPEGMDVPNITTLTRKKATYEKFFGMFKLNDPSYINYTFTWIEDQHLTDLIAEKYPDKIIVLTGVWCASCYGDFQESA